MTPKAHQYHLNVRVADRAYRLDFQQAFRFGYTLLRTGKLAEACQVFEAMTHSETPARLAMIMLAYCKVGLKDYAASKAILCQVFADDEQAKAEQLHTAFVDLNVGMRTDAVEELTAAAREWPDLPVVCLLLGDLLASQGRRGKATLCWRLAIARDDDNGAVAAVAQHLVSSQTKSHANA